MKRRSKYGTISEGGNEGNYSESFPQNFPGILLAKMEESTQRMKQSTRRIEQIIERSTKAGTELYRNQTIREKIITED